MNATLKKLDLILKATFICGFAEDICMPFIDGLMVLNEKSYFSNQRIYICFEQNYNITYK